MSHFMDTVQSPLFEGIAPEERVKMLSCFGYYLGSFQKGETVTMEGSYVRHFGVVLSGSVDMGPFSGALLYIPSAPISGIPLLA